MFSLFKMIGIVGSRWCFTLNNYTVEEYDLLMLFRDKCKYLVVGKEVGDNGTNHLQGYFNLKNRCRLAGLKRILGNRYHFELAKGSELQASIYCKKDGDFLEYGSIAKNGKRTDIEAFKDDVKLGVLDMRELREKHSVVCARYSGFVTAYLLDHGTPPDVPCFPFRKWQKELNLILNREPDDRTIFFIVDTVGNSGKSWFARFYCNSHKSCQILTPGKKADMAHMLHDNRVFFIDSPRSTNEFLQYGLFEEMKNGYVQVSKYYSHMKPLQKCHIVVLMNQQPDMSKLSEDRYVIVNIDTDSIQLAL